MLSYVTAGESHGESLVGIITGFPAGVKISVDKINAALSLRQNGYGRGKRMSIEKDTVKILSGIRCGYTLGSPITLQIKNKDYENWKPITNPICIRDKELYEKKMVLCPRPGHADLFGGIKYRHLCDLRNVLERSSARETAIRTAIGNLCRQFLENFGIEFYAFVVQIGEIVLPSALETDYNKLLKQYEKADDYKIRILDKEFEESVIEYIDIIREKKDTIGGKIRLLIKNVPIGLGTYTHWEEKLDARLAYTLMSIQAVKEVQFGIGIEQTLIGSNYHDEIFYDKKAKRFYHKTNRCGGIIGGMSNGEIIDIKITMKPIPTLMMPLKTVDLKTKESVEAVKERSDVCALTALSVIVENISAYEIMRAFLLKFGHDNLQEIKNNYESYLEYLKSI